MELNQDHFLEEYLALKRESWETIIPAEMNEFFQGNNGWNFNGLNENLDPSSIQSSSSFEGFSSPNLEPKLVSHSFSNVSLPFQEELILASQVTAYESSYAKLDMPSFHGLEDYPPFPFMEDGEVGVLRDYDIQNMEVDGLCQNETNQAINEKVPANSDNNGVCMEKKNKSKKLQGQPSKNLMAERRRRKRLNDRLSMLRSIVPKISKMDRTSILGDTIDYMKELLDRIHNLQAEIGVGDPNQLNLLNIFKDLQQHNEVFGGNAPKFEVERRKMDTKIEISCTGKPGSLLSTISTLESLDIEIQQCVISCFNDFAMHASCSEEVDQRTIEDIKQALFMNAGYGGRCL